jgi:hypothetical protein
VLERANTDAARQLLADLGKSDRETWLAREARAATARLEKLRKEKSK